MQRFAKNSDIKVSSNMKSFCCFRSLSSIADEFKELAESILLVLHLEVRIHCFFFLGRAIREVSSDFDMFKVLYYKLYVDV